MRYAIVIEWAETNFSAYAPDLPGCISTGDTIEEIERNMTEAMKFHLEGMREDGDPIPKPVTRVKMVDIGTLEA